MRGEKAERGTKLSSYTVVSLDSDHHGTDTWRVYELTGRTACKLLYTS